MQLLNDATSANTDNSVTAILVRFFGYFLFILSLFSQGLICSESFADVSAPLPLPPEFGKSSNIKFGDFQFLTRAEAGLKATDNIRLDQTERKDTMQQLNLAASVNSDWQRHAISSSISYLAQEARNTANEDTDSLSATLSGRLDIGSEVDLKLGLLRDETIIGKNDPLQFSGYLNGTSRSNIVEGGIEWDNKQQFISLQGRHFETITRSQVEVIGLTEVLDLDRNEEELTLQAGLHQSWGKYYLFGGIQDANYEGSENALTQERDSSGSRLGIGLELGEDALQAVFRIIAFNQDFDAPTIEDVNDYVGLAELIYKVDEQWTLSGILERNFEETNIQDSAGLFSELAAIGLLYIPRSDLYFKVSPAYRVYKIAGTPYEAKSRAIDATLGWQAASTWQILTKLTLSDQTVNDSFLSTYEYKENALTLSVVVSL